MTKNHSTDSSSSSSSSVWSNTSHLRDALKNQSTPVLPASTRPIVVTAPEVEQQQQQQQEDDYEKLQETTKDNDEVESSLVRHTEHSLSLHSHLSSSSPPAGGEAGEGEHNSMQLSFEKRRVLVLDTSSLLRWSDIRLEQLGTVFYTTPGIIEEIRDSQSRSALSTMPLQLRVRAPLPESLLQVKKYALKTGDYSALSANDMAILGLSYELEMELNGKNNCLKPVPEDLNIQSGGRYRKVPIVPWETVFGNTADDGHDDNVEDQEDNGGTDNDGHDDDDGWVTYKKKSKSRRKIDIAGESALFNFYESEESNAADDDATSTSSSAAGTFGEENSGWITPGNVEIKKQQTSGVTNTEEWGNEEVNSGDGVTAEAAPADTTAATTTKVASSVDSQLDRSEPSKNHIGCVTTDYAMQNVLLHMGIDLVSFDGKRIKELKRWVKRCESCSCLVTDMMRQFCPLCGNHTLKRVTCYIDSEGKEHFLFNARRMRPNLRGTIFHIPRPKGGRRNLDPILTEDMTKHYQYGIPKKNSHLLSKKNWRSVRDGDPTMNMVFSSDYTFDKSIKKKQLQQKDISVLKDGVWTGYGRRNPNEPVQIGRAHV